MDPIQPFGSPCSCTKISSSKGSLPAIFWLKTVLFGGVGLGLWFALYLQLKTFAHFFTTTLLGLDPTSHLGRAVEFFVYDSPKVMLLLTLIVYVVGIIRSFFTQERTRKYLAGKRETGGNVMAALLGIVTPFCSCSAIPLFLGFCPGRRPPGGHLLLSHCRPHGQRNCPGPALRPPWLEGGGSVPWNRPVDRHGGWLGDRPVAPRNLDGGLGPTDARRPGPSSWNRNSPGPTVCRWAKRLCAISSARCGYTSWQASPLAPSSTAMFRRISWPLSWGNRPGGRCRQRLPSGCRCIPTPRASYPWSRPCSARVPALGTVLAFMMSVIALSLPEMIILRKVLKPQLIAVFIGVVACGIVLIGYLFNLII